MVDSWTEERRDAATPPRNALLGEVGAILRALLLAAVALAIGAWVGSWVDGPLPPASPAAATR